MFASCAGTPSGDTGGAWSPGRRAGDEAISALLEAGRYEEVLALVDSLMGAGETDPRLLGQQARALGGLGRMEEAVSVFEEAILGDYEGCENHLNFAVLLMRMGRTGRAVTEFQVAKRFCGRRKELLIGRNLAVAYLKMGNRDRAFKYVKEGLEISPGDPYLLGLKGMLIARTAPVEAESLFVRLKRTRGLEPEFLHQFGLLLLNNNRPREAVDALEAAAEADPDGLEVRLHLAEALLRADRFTEAEARFRELYERDHEEQAGLGLGRALFKQERYAEALSVFMKLSRTAEVMDRIAMCHHGLGALDEALLWIKMTLAERPDWVSAMINAAVIHAARGELDDAEHHLTRALQLDPDNPAARANLDRLENARSPGASVPRRD
jgi:tetratricopeptide (TPR) repeat protein